MQKLRWGFIGAGWIADIMAADFKLAGIDVRAITNRNPQRAQNLAAKHGIAKVHASVAELVADPEIDVVYISTNNNVHLEHSLAAMNAGKHVLCEKPLAMDADQAKTFVETAAANKVFAMEAMWSRFLPAQIKLREFIFSGGLGAVQHINAEYSEFSSRITKPRLFNPATGGGAIMDLGVYPLALISSILGQPKTIHTNSVLESGVDLTDSVSLSFAGGATANIFTSIVNGGFNRAEIHLTGGRIEYGSPIYGEVDWVAYDHQGEVVYRHQAHQVIGSGRAYQGLELERCVQAGLVESPTYRLSESISQMQLVDEIRSLAGVTLPTL